MFKRIQSLFVCLVLLCAAIAGGQANADETQQPGIKVTVLIYSGRDNPVFYLRDEKDITTLKGFIDGAKQHPSFKEKTVLPARLGYNGVTVENMGGKSALLPKSLQLYQGVMEVERQEKSFLLDENKKLEDWLLDKALQYKVIDKYMRDKIKEEK